GRGDGSVGSQRRSRRGRCCIDDNATRLNRATYRRTRRANTKTPNSRDQTWSRFTVSHFSMLNPSAAESHRPILDRLGIYPPLVWGYVGLLFFMIGDGVEAGYLSKYLVDRSIASEHDVA